MGDEMKGCICLDIDGTITANPLAIPEETLELLKELLSIFLKVKKDLLILPILCTSWVLLIAEAINP